MVEHYFAPKPSSKLVTKTIVIEVGGRRFEFETAAGTFAFGKLDLGTRTLLKFMKPKGRVMDLGCGIGIVGIVVAKEGFDVTMVDVNERAIRFARRNARKNKVKPRIVCSDLFERMPDLFDCILTNPPMAAGLKQVFRFVDESFSHLRKGGSLQLVARAKKGGTRIAAHMKEVFGNVEDVGRQGGFHVYMSVKE